MINPSPIPHEYLIRRKVPEPSLQVSVVDAVVYDVVVHVDLLGLLVQQVVLEVGALRDHAAVLLLQEVGDRAVERVPGREDSTQKEV